MRRVTHYIVVSLDMVQNRLNKGWQPWGQPVYLGTNLQDFGVVCQAMVKYKESVVQDMGPK